MTRRLFFKSLVANWGIIFLAGLALTNSLAAEKLKIAIPVKDSAVYALPVLAAEEKGFWRQEGLQAELISFSGGILFIHALAAGQFDLGLASATFLIPPVAHGGVDVLITADLKTVQPFYIWVLPDSPIKGPRDLEGTKVGIGTLGGLPHSLGLATIKRFGLEGKVRFVGTGGARETIAAFKSKAIDALVFNLFLMANLKSAGQAREIAGVTEYLPRDWMDVTIFARREIVGKNPEVVRKVVRSTLRATDFLMNNRQWSIEKLKSVSGYSEEAAPEVYKLMTFSKDGKINRTGLENVLNFLIEYGIVPKEKAPPVDKLFTREFTQ